MMKCFVAVLFVFSQIFPLVARAQTEVSDLVEPTGGAVSNFHDLVVWSIKVPKRVKFTPGVTKTVKVLIQNLSNHEEVFTNLDVLGQVVALSSASFGDCPVPFAEIQTPKKGFPLALGINKKLTVYYRVIYDCMNDPAKGVGHEDFRYSVNVFHSKLDGILDDIGYNDNCPRAPVEGDKGCGSIDPMTHKRGGGIYIDFFQ